MILVPILVAWSDFFDHPPSSVYPLVSSCYIAAGEKMIFWKMEEAKKANAGERSGVATM